MERPDGLVEDPDGHAGMEQRAQEHVSRDAGEAFKVGDAHV